MLEDSPTDAELIQRVLKKDKPDCAFFLASEREVFLSALENFQPDLILADNSLPQFDAREALRIVRQRGLQIPFIMVSGTMQEEYAVQIIKEGADDYILKDRLTRLPSAAEAAIRLYKTEENKAVIAEKLEETETRYQQVADRISDGFMLVDKNWGVKYANTAADRMFGLAPGMLLGKKLNLAFPQAMDRSFFRSYLLAMETGNTQHVEDYSVVADRWLQASYYPSDEGVAVFFRNVTEQRKAEEEQRKSEQKYRTFIERITDAFISLDKNWCYTYLNKQAGELIKRDPEKMVGKNVWAEFPDAVNSSTFEAFSRAMTEQCYVTNIDYYPPLDLWQENHIYPSEDGISVFIRNISEKKKLEQQLAEQQRREKRGMIMAALEAQEKERNAIAIELHDNVNQILVGTRVILSMLRDQPADSLSVVNTCMDQLSLAISENRKIAHELVTPDLEKSTLVQQLEKLGKTMLDPAGLEYFIQHESQPAPSIGKKQQLALYRVAQEQCTNIVKYAEARSVIFTLIIPEAQQLVFRISDDGKGADPSELRKGIGLQNISNRISVYGGQMEIRTSPGNGFEMEISLPLKESEE